MNRLSGYIFLLLGLITFACKNPQESVEPQVYDVEATKNPVLLDRSVKKLTDVIVHDIFSPPVASRNYVYPLIAAYETLRHGHPEYKTLAGQLQELKAGPAPIADQPCNFEIAAIHAFLKTAQNFIFSEQKMEEFGNEIYAEYAAMNVPKDIYDRSIAYGDAMSAHVMEWSSGDLYKQTRTYPRYSVEDEPGRWTPTPPGYMDGIEPHWNKIRTMVLDSAQQFQPLPPTRYDIKEGSKFHTELMEVYDVVKNANEEQIEIASFWDCNPYVSHTVGHVMYATKKITPGGHWMGITRTATRQANLDMMASTEVYTMVAIALFDGFISCWDEKYNSNLTRPETVINGTFDESWLPLLQTPPFPEHTSGHSVISTAAAVVLTEKLGPSFSFVDSTEVEYGLPPRSFDSFLAASEEAAISRLYGGIHYRPAIEYGVEQGRKVGEFVTARLEMKR